jgi:hypothetical protein
LQTEAVVAGSYHHQGIDAVAPGFVPVAIAADGVVEGIEKAADGRVLAVQFHPEREKGAVRTLFFQSFIADAASFHHVRTEEPAATGTPVAAEAPKVFFDAAAASNESRGTHPTQVMRQSVPPPPPPPSREKVMREGLGVLDNHGWELRDGDWRLVMADNLPRYGSKYFVIKKQKPSHRIEVPTKDAAEELLLSLLPWGRSHLSDYTRDTLDAVRTLRQAGAHFYRPRMFWGKAEPELEIQHVWLLNQHRLLMRLPGQSYNTEVRTLPTLTDAAHFATRR